jgi:hypothetical protein
MATLTISKLWYEPPTDVFQIAEDRTRLFLQDVLPESLAKSLPHFISERSTHSPINTGSCRGPPGAGTVLLTKSLSERKTLLELIANRRFGGIFDGDVSIDGTKPSTSFDSNVAYIHRVREN